MPQAGKEEEEKAGSSAAAQCNEWIKKFWGQYPSEAADAENLALAKFKPVELVEADPGSVKLVELDVQNVSDSQWASGCYLG